MKIINIRTPHSIVIDEENQIETKINIYIWNRPNIEPLVPTYSFSSIVPSLSNRIAIYNISNEVKEFINPIIPDYNFGITVENFKMWCYVKVEKFFRTDPSLPFEFIDDENYIGVDGYNSYQQGINFSLTRSFKYLTKSTDILERGIMFFPSTLAQITNYKYPKLNVLIENQNDGGYFVDYDNDTQDNQINIILTEGVNMYSIPLYNPNLLDLKPYSISIRKYDGEDEVTKFIRKYDLICETKYEPLLLSFINKDGGWENIWCMKASENNLDTKETEFKTNQGFQNFNANIGQRKSFNKNGKQSIKVNTGYVPEHTKTMIEELFLSETIILDSKPVMLKGNATILKKEIKELINYTLDFEFNFNVINDVV